MKNKGIKVLTALAAVASIWATSISTQAQDCCIQISAPSNTATINITSPFLVTGDTNAADNVATFIEQVIVGNPSVAPGNYPGWCVDIVDDIDKGPKVYSTVMHSSCDTNLNQELQAGYPANVYVSPDTWHLINYILNHKGSNYFWNIQEALWYFIGGPPLILGPPYPPTDPAAVQAIIDDAQANGPAWQMQCGDIEAVVVEIQATPLEQLTIIEVPTTPTCNITFTKIPPGGDLGCNPTNIPDCTGAVDTNVINATASSGTVTITCSKNDSIVNCKNVRVITYVATSSSGCSATNVQTVSWTVDTTIPNLTVPQGTNLGCNPGTLPQDSDIQALSKATDTCSTPTIAVTHADSGSPCGYTRVFTVTATDACKNVATGYVTFTWTVDTTAPTITSIPASTNFGCNPANLPTTNSIQALVKATDSCGSVNITVTSQDGGTPCAMTRTFTITATDGCKNSTITNVTYYWKVDTSGPIITCPADYYISNGVTQVTCYNQDGWRGACSSNPCTIISNCWSKIYSNGYIQCGVSGYYGHSITCSDFKYVKNLLPCSGTPSCLNWDYNNPSSCNGGAFPGHVLCLQLNVDCSDHKDVTGFKGSFGDCVLNDSSCPLNGKKIRDICNICNTALGGGSTSGCSIGQLSDLCSNLNNCFSNCIPSEWCKSHITNIVTTNVPPSVSGYATAVDSCGGAVSITNSDVITAGNCGGAYTITRTWIAKDSCGNVSTCVQHIYIGNSSASVCGYVFKDCNGDGRLSVGIDVGISNILVTLKNGSGVIVASNTTDNTGAYCFYNLTPGTYSVCIAQPSGHTQTAGCHTNHWLDNNSNDCWNENDGYQHWKGSDGVDCWYANDGCQHYKNSYGQDCWKDRYGYTHTQNCNYTSCNVPKGNCETFTVAGCEAKTSVNFAYQGATGSCQVSCSGPSRGICGQTSTYTCKVTNTGTACISACNVSVCGNSYPCPSLKPGESCSFQFNYCYRSSDYGNFNCKATASCNYNGGSNCYGSGSCNTSVGYW